MVDSAPTDPTAEVALVVVPALAVAVFALYRRTALEARPEGLWHRRLFTTELIPWTAIEDVRLDTMWRAPLRPLDQPVLTLVFDSAVPVTRRLAATKSVSPRHLDAFVQASLPLWGRAVADRS